MKGLMGWGKLALAALIGVVNMPAAQADSWDLPRVETYESADKSWRFVVTPRPLESQLEYFQDEIRREKNGTPPRVPLQRAQGKVEHLRQGRWQAVWNGPLLNDVSPVSALVSPNGQVVTFDNWHSAGFGINVVVIYDSSGKTVRSMALKDFLPDDYVYALPQSVSSMLWSGEHVLSADGKRVILRVVVPDDVPEQHYVDLSFDLASGQPAPIDQRAWARAMAAATKAAAERRAIEAERHADFIAPLTTPSGGQESDWSGYLREAFYRLDPGWENGYANTVVLSPPQAPEYADSLAAFRDALSPECKSATAVLFASPSQDNLVAAFSERVAQLANGSLKGARIYVAVNDAHSAAVAKALAHTGATYIQLDPARPIEQSKVRLDQYLHPR
ncbi:hypothetical protein [Lysobacter sp. TAB13]|uniref:hypothetical protein n=1 Tax=Lysobacter sp. TAB13 TaxID=3233065 RepID=UPI003F9DC2FA